MGEILYGTPPSRLSFDDRLLAHLKLVIVAKLRRGEPFLLSWERPPEAGSGRMSLWMHPAIPLQFSFAGSRMPAINPVWIEQMTLLANGPLGLKVIPEPDPSALAESPVLA